MYLSTFPPPPELVFTAQLCAFLFPTKYETCDPVLTDHNTHSLLNFSLVFFCEAVIGALFIDGRVWGLTVIKRRRKLRPLCGRQYNPMRSILLGTTNRGHRIAREEQKGQKKHKQRIERVGGGDARGEESSRRETQDRNTAPMINDGGTGIRPPPPPTTTMTLRGGGTV